MKRQQWQLSPTARSVPEARRNVTGALRAWGLEQLVETAILLTSELVTNAVLHARTNILLMVEGDDGSIRVSVHDSSPVAPTLRHHSDTATTGRGLHLLEQLADSWSAESTLDGKTVWFALSTGRDPWASRGHFLADA